MKIITFKVDDELFEKLSKLDNKSEFIKSLINTHYKENKNVIIDKDGNVLKADNILDSIKTTPSSQFDSNMIKNNFKVFFELFTQNSEKLKISESQKTKIKEIQGWLRSI